jgi:ribosomal protein S6 kinase alpha-5
VEFWYVCVLFFQAVNVHLLGVIAFELLTGCSPFTVEGDQNSSHDIARRILTKKVPFPRTMDETSKNFITQLLEKDPSRRLGAKGVEDIKKHPFFAGINWEHVEQRKLKPPIQPVISSNLDVTNFAPEFTNQVPIFSPGEAPADFRGLFQGYSFVSPSVIFANNNVIGEECLEENIKLLAKDSSFFSKYDMDLTAKGFLGRGTFSVCRKCRRLSDDKEFAVKIVSQKFAHHALREIRILELVNPHENIVSITEALSDQLHYYIVLELLQGGELLQRLRRMNTFTECQASSIMAQLVSAVTHIHSKGVVHRDLKPENILFESDAANAKLRLVDFGFARLLPNSFEALNTPCYTLAFAAPEVLEMDDELPQYNQQCDLWSLGVILFTMLSGKVPFHAKSTTESANEIIARIRQAEFSFEDRVWDFVSDTAKDLINGLLTVDPKKRLSLAQLARHPWLRNENTATELQTPTVLPSTADETFNETLNAFLSANRDGFHLMDVTTAPLLIKRRGLKRRLEGETNGGPTRSEVNRKTSGLSTVPEVSESTSRRPTTLAINESETNGAEASPNSALFTEYRDTKPPYLKYSRDVEADGDGRRDS